MLLSLFNDINKLISNSEINEYRNYVYALVKKIYDLSFTAYFDIKNGTYKKNARPINIELNISGDGGEGVNEVKKNIIDILLFKYNVFMKYLFKIHRVIMV